MKNGNKIFTFLFSIASLLVSPLALAHEQNLSSSFLTGLSHPITGLDHLLVLMIAGLFMGRLTAAKGLAFFSGLLMTLGLGVGGGLLPGSLPGSLAWLEVAILLSLPVFLGLFYFRKSVSVSIAFFSMGLFMVFHGWVHGLELAAMHSSFIFGLFLSSALVMGLSSLFSRFVAPSEITTELYVR